MQASKAVEIIERFYGLSSLNDPAVGAAWQTLKAAVLAQQTHNNARDETVRSCAECKVPNRTIESCFFCFLEKYQRTASPVA